MYNILNDYFCTVPFSYLEIHKDNVYGCCPSWLSKSYGSTDKLNEIWNGDIATKIRLSILDGTYKFCDKNNCPHLSQLIHTKHPTINFIKKESNLSCFPTRINLSFDNSCNLKCPSCRSNFIMESNTELLKNEQIMKDISTFFGNSVSYLYISGTSDPFASKTFSNFLKNFNIELFPKLQNIHLHTNGLLFDEKMWKSIEKSHKYIKTIEISIDAATKETYEKIRVGGNWNTLMNNLKFISSIKTIREKIFSFVIQDTNFNEMKMFYDLIMSLPKIKRQENLVYFGKILNWGTYSDDFLKKQIWNEKHLRFNEFLIELNKIGNLYNSSNNMNNIIEKYSLKTKIDKLI